MDWLFTFICCYVVFAVFILYTLLLGQTEFHRDGYIGWCHMMLTSGLQEYCVGCFGRICPKRLKKVGDSIYDYFMYKPNHILQGFYLSLVVVGYFLFYKDCFPYIGTEYIHEYHRYGAYFAISFTLFTFILASYSSPNYITDQNHKENILYSYDRYLYIKKNCETCNFIKPARSKHCRICDKCVSKFDHHCPWINNCVGRNNLRWFLLFVLSTALLCLYGSYLCGWSLYTFIKIKDIRNLGYTKNGVWTPIPTTILLKYLAFESRSIIPLGVFCFVISLFLLYFFFYHIYLICKNTTTNETFKWQDIKDQIKIQRLEEKLKEKEEKEKNDQSSSKINNKDKDNKNNNNNNNNKESNNNSSLDNQVKKRKTSNKDDIKDKDRVHLPLPKYFKELKNEYNKGPYLNLMEAIFPNKFK